MNLKSMIFLAICLFSRSIFALEIGSLSSNPAVRFGNAVRVAESEKATYSISLSALAGGFFVENRRLLARPDLQPENRFKELKISRNLPAKYDLREKGCVTPAKNQGDCGSCWAHTFTGIFESLILMHDKVATDLSEQDLMNCNKKGYGCDGGYEDVLQYFVDQGAALEKDCPYVGHELACQSGISHPYKLSGWKVLDTNESTPPAPEIIKQAILDYGPVSVSVAADDSFMLYHGGIFNHDGQELNHLVMLVGWDDSMGSKGCWILKNSGGPQWGENGFMYIEYGKSKVGIYPAILQYK
ncbi:MAG: C1 family peptidase [Candidatus Wallbacteria bacterium]|nr:C1 family peptidase [Candidatus Wallbacteria bacterium]